MLLSDIDMLLPSNKICQLLTSPEEIMITADASCRENAMLFGAVIGLQTQLITKLQGSERKPGGAYWMPTPSSLEAFPSVSIPTYHIIYCYLQTPGGLVGTW